MIRELHDQSITDKISCVSNTQPKKNRILIIIKNEKQNINNNFFIYHLLTTPIYVKNTVKILYRQINNYLLTNTLLAKYQPRYQQ